MSLHRQTSPRNFFSFMTGLTGDTDRTNATVNIKLMAAAETCGGHFGGEKCGRYS